MLWLYRLINGYLLLEISGEFSERLLNLCAKNHIALWNLRYKKGKITGCILIGDFRSLRHVRKGKRIHIHILQKIGLPFAIKKYRNRFGFFIGIVLFFVIINYMSGFIWTIQVSGNKSIDDKTIIDACCDIGIKEGIKKGGFDAKSKCQELLLKSDRLAWASMNIEGCVMTIEVTEIKNNTSPDEKTPTNLKASADGVIKKIDITSGNSVVKVGDIVCKGDILVSGVVEGLSATRFVHSAGTVTALTEREITASADFIQTVSLKTGRSVTKNVVSAFHIKMPLYLGETLGNYRTETVEKRAKLFGEKLPFKLSQKHFEFLKENECVYDENQLETQLMNDIEKQIAQLKIENYTVKDKKIAKDDTGMTMTVIINAEENIAYQDILLFNSGNQ